MNKAAIKIDNTNIRQKIKLRKYFLKKNKKYIILDCYAGRQKIWNNIKKDFNCEVIYIDKKGGTIKGDNLKVLSMLDLNNYDIIDLDAYGIPYKQLEIVFKKNIKNKIIFITFIQTNMGKLNSGMLNKIGYTNKMIKKCPTLFNKNGFEKFCLYLAINGVKKIYYIDNNPKKHYICFILNPE